MMRNNFSTRSIGLALILALLTACGGTTVKEEVATETEIQQAISPGSTQTLNPDDFSQYHQAVDTLNSGDNDKATKLLQKISRRNPSYGPAQGNLALAYYRSGRLDEAETAILAAVQLAPESAGFYNLRGLIAVDRRDFKTAEQAYLKALALNPEHALAHYNIALLYDIYFQKIPQAYQHYLTYLNLIDYQDKDTVDWVEQLQYSVEAKQ